MIPPLNQPTDPGAIVRRPSARLRQRAGFTLIELLVVISIISLLISILMPSLSRAREQGRAVHCLARLKEFGNAIAAYENLSGGVLPPALWRPAPEDSHTPAGLATAVPSTGDTAAIEYGWQEILFKFVYLEDVRVPQSYPVQRNINGRRWEKYFLCRSAGEEGISSGHYRVYLPSWSGGTFGLGPDGRWTENTRAIPESPAVRDAIRPKLPLIGDANERSERGDGLGLDDCSYIDAGEANYAGSDGRSGNRFSDRHSGGSNYLFQDLHGAWSTSLREELARDFDLNGVIDVTVRP